MLLNQHGNKYRLMAEMNMIPLIDVALVLLIIFMMMTPMLVRSQIKLNLPVSKTTEQMPPPQQVIQITMEKNGTIYINDQPIKKGTLDSKLKEIVVDPKNQPIIIEADKDIPFQYVVNVLDSAKRLGVAKVGISVKRDSKNK